MKNTTNTTIQRIQDALRAVPHARMVRVSARKDGHPFLIRADASELLSEDSGRYRLWDLATATRKEARQIWQYVEQFGDERFTAEEIVRITYRNKTIYEAAA